MILYHGTDLDSALTILNEGLDAQRLSSLQAQRPTQLGPGWYAAMEPEAAWFFASLAPGNRGDGYTVVELELPDEIVERLIAAGQAKITVIHNVPFAAEQIWFDVATFATLNHVGIFRPSRSKEGFIG
ncbi:MAG: hypothetical protein R3C14_00395 [Caldilineaceae bacterium]